VAGIYLHIPFCKQACHYCDFHFSTNQRQRTSLIMAMVKEIELQKNYLQGEVIHTLYFGGGTPSLLSEHEFLLLFSALHKNFTIDANAEITVEGNPDDLDELKLRMLRQLGVNRLSIGIQSFHDAMLTYLNRAHTGVSARQCVLAARAVGFSNISIDLIYAIPNETLAVWEEDIAQALSLNPEHVSCYSLTIEPKTAFGKWEQQGRLKAVDDEVAAEHLEILMEQLEHAGYEHYEISNFAKPGFQSQHNSSYWKQAQYLGIGPSAHSYNGVSRQYTVSNNQQYLQSLEKGEVPFEKEVLTRADQINEFILTSLRTSWGCNTSELHSLYAYDLLVERELYIQKMLSENQAVLLNKHLILTKKGKLLADKIASDLFVVA
jgi:oxygen-independent coproporphyrinogen III oxidase